PSTNMPTLDIALVYIGAALIEGTNVSEGRGTTTPFEFIGAPFVNSTEYADTLNDLDLPGVTFRAASFTPTFSKHSGELSHGVQIHITDKEAYDSVVTGLHIVKTLHDLYPEEFEFREEDSEGVSFFDNLIGNGWIREAIENGESVETMVSEWQAELQSFKEVRRDYLIYSISIDEIINELENLKEDGHIEDEAMRLLNMHLTAVAQYEAAGTADKVTKHMEGFKLLLDQQKNSKLISEKAYNILKASAHALFKQWE